MLKFTDRQAISTVYSFGGCVGKREFVDYYEALQISPNAQPETVQRVYRLLAQMYHPDNSETGDLESFNRVLEAYRVLSDPAERAAYDVEYRAAVSLRWKIFDQSAAPQGIESEKRKRIGILSLLYNKRLHEPQRPALGMLDFEQLLGCPREHLDMSLWYLRESGCIQRSDNAKFTITAKGLDLLEQEESSQPGVQGRRLLVAPIAAAASA